MQSMTLDTNNLSTSLEALAEALGANYDSEAGTIYKGSDPQAGFNFYFDSDNSNRIEIRLKDAQNAIGYPNGSTQVFYETSGNCCVFGLEYTDTSNGDRTSKVQCAIVPYSSSAGSGYLHIIRGVYNIGA